MKHKSIFRIARADGEADVAQARMLFREYAAALSVDLCFQNFESELASLPGEYAPPTGRLYLAFVTASQEGGVSDQHDAPTAATGISAGVAGQADATGCVALRKFDSTSCEMKRLYVRPEFRGQGIARGLVEEVMQAARELKYRKVLLDTLPEMAEAQALYRSLGFREVPPYRTYTEPGVRFFELALP